MMVRIIDIKFKIWFIFIAIIYNRVQSLSYGTYLYFMISSRDILIVSYIVQLYVQFYIQFYV